MRLRSGPRGKPWGTATKGALGTAAVDEGDGVDSTDEVDDRYEGVEIGGEGGIWRVLEVAGLDVGVAGMTTACMVLKSPVRFDFQEVGLDLFTKYWYASLRRKTTMIMTTSRNSKRDSWPHDGAADGRSRSVFAADTGRFQGFGGVNMIPRSNVFTVKTGRMSEDQCTMVEMAIHTRGWIVTTEKSVGERGE